MEVTNNNSFAIEIPDMAIHIETPISDFDRLITLIRRFIQRDRMLCKKQNFEPLLCPEQIKIVDAKGNSYSIFSNQPIPKSNEN